MEIKVNLENNKVDIHMTSDEVLKLMSNLTRLLVELSDSQMKGGGSVEIANDSGEATTTIHVEKMYCV